MSFDPVGKSIDQILDYGAPGLQYWEHFLPLYARAFGAPEGHELADLCARYDEQRGADLDEFDTARTELDKALTDAESRWSSHQAIAQTLPTAWTGATGGEALTIVNSQLRRARDDLDTIRTASTAIEAALGPLRQSVLAKAEHALALLEPTPDGLGRVAIGGKTPGDIEELDTDDPWLTGTFRADVDRKLAAFSAACAATNETFESHYRTIVTALAQVIDHPYPQPAQALLPQPETSPATSMPAPQPLPAPACPATTPPPTMRPQPSQYPAAAPESSPPSADDTIPGPRRTQSQGRPSDAPPGTSPGGADATAPAATTQSTGAAEPGGAALPMESAQAGTPETSQPRSDQFARTLKDTLDQLETSLQQGISAAVEKLGSLADQTPPSSADLGTETDPKSESDPPSPSALPSGRLEFDVAGKHFFLERTPDGDLTLAVTDESGQTHTYTVSFDQNGTPALATGDPAHTPTEPAGDASEPTSPTPADSPPTAAGGEATDTPKNTQPDPAGATSPDTEPPRQPSCEPRTCTVPAPAVAPSPVPCPDNGPDQPAPPQVSSLPPAVDDGKPSCAQPSTPDPTPEPVSGCPLPSPTPTELLGPQPLENPAPPTATGQPGPGAPPAAPAPSLAEPDMPMEIPEGGVEIPETTPLATS